MNVEPGRGFPLTVRLKNTGVRAWAASGENQVTIEANRPTGDAHPLQHKFWASSSRVTRLSRAVQPGEEVELFLRFSSCDHRSRGRTFYLTVQNVGLISGGMIHFQLMFVQKS